MMCVALKFLKYQKKVFTNIIQKYLFININVKIISPHQPFLNKILFFFKHANYNLETTDKQWCGILQYGAYKALVG